MAHLLSQLDSTVVLILFNRPDTTKLVFDAIVAAKPERLLVIADGPRPHIKGEAALCAQARAVVENINWRCDVRLNYSDVNLGCRERVISGLDWAFSIVDEAIILEDDCVPDPTFFSFCSELLARYRSDPRIGMIAGTNFVENATNIRDSYYFSRLIHIWGWATWRRAWESYDRNLSQWPKLRANGFLQQIFSDQRVIAHWADTFDKMHVGHGPNTWDIQWVFTCFAGRLLAVVPRVNLIHNVGFGPNATHTLVADPRIRLQRKSIDFPLRHPSRISPVNSLDKLDAKLGLPSPLHLRTIWKLKRLLGSRGFTR